MPVYHAGESRVRLTVAGLAASPALPLGVLAARAIRQGRDTALANMHLCRFRLALPLDSYPHF